MEKQKVLRAVLEQNYVRASEDKAVPHLSEQPGTKTQLFLTAAPVFVGTLRQG